MTRGGVAVLLAVVAGLAVVATTIVAVSTYTARDEPGPTPPATEPLVVTDPATAATFEVPDTAWRVRGPRERIYYTDDEGRAVAVAHGPAVYRAGYCAARPRGSSRAFAGFTRQPFDAWMRGLSGGRGIWTTGESRDQVVLDDGTRTTVRWTGLMGGKGPCAAPGIELAMVRAGDIRVVLVADSGESGTLDHEQIVAVLSSLQLAEPDVAD